MIILSFVLTLLVGIISVSLFRLVTIFRKASSELHKKLESSINEIMMQNLELSRHIDGLKSAVATLNREISSLNRDNSILHNQVSSLTQDITNLVKER